MQNLGDPRTSRRRFANEILVRFRQCAIALIALQLSFGGGLFIFPGIASADEGVPSILSYQGRLTDGSGDLLGGSSGTTFYFKFSIWDSATVGVGTKLWPAVAPTSVSATVTKGVFHVNIGDTAGGYPDVLDFDFQEEEDVFLQVEVSSNNTSFETLSPRQRITSAGFAINARTAGGFTPSQAPTDNNIPVLTNGNLLLAGTNPQINASSTNNLVLQGGSGTGDIHFFSSANRLTSAGNLIIAGTLTAPNLNFNYATGTQKLTVATLTVTSTTEFNGVVYSWPGSDGSGGQVLSTNGSGTLSWTNVSTGADTDWIQTGSTLYATTTATKVGIGTTNPAFLLDVAGEARISSSSIGVLHVTSSLSVPADSITLTTDTVGDYVASLLAGTGISVSAGSGEGSTPTISVTGSDQTFGSSTIGILTVTSSASFSYASPSRLTYLDADRKLQSVSDLTSWISGTANRISVSDDGDGTLTLTTPQDLHSAAILTFSGLSLTNTTSTNATSTNLAVTGSLSIPADSIGSDELSST
ncbi:MAG: hypothetical protein Q8P45_01945, partial [Candidatus Harrisonbacteria bacterium]|nr:hypothetical protein [Candidatus Harrisonbacteria bacterium]